MTEEVPVRAENAASGTEEIVEDLKKEMDTAAYHGNPAIYHTAFSAVAGSVPTLQVPTEEAPEEEPSRKSSYQN